MIIQFGGGAKSDVDLMPYVYEYMQCIVLYYYVIIAGVYVCVHVMYISL